LRKLIRFQQTKNTLMVKCSEALAACMVRIVDPMEYNLHKCIRNKVAWLEKYPIGSIVEYTNDEGINSLYRVKTIKERKDPLWILVLEELPIEGKETSLFLRLGLTPSREKQIKFVR